jgi:hypothetical protein
MPNTGDKRGGLGLTVLRNAILPAQAGGTGHRAEPLKPFGRNPREPSRRGGRRMIEEMINEPEGHSTSRFGRYG